MAWDTDMIIMLRHMIDDLSDNPTYSDARLKQLILTSVLFVQRDAEFSTTYTVNLTTLTLSPDPTLDGNDDLVNLTLLRAACTLSETDLRANACKFIKVSDARSSIDNTAALKAYQSIYEGASGPCALYKQSILDYRINSSANLGRAIMTPIRTQVLHRHTETGDIYHAR